MKPLSVNEYLKLSNKSQAQSEAGACHVSEDVVSTDRPVTEGTSSVFGKQHHLYRVNICDLVASTSHPLSSASSLAWNKSPNQSLRSALNGMEPKSACTESEKYQGRQETATTSEASGESSQNEETESCCLSGNGNEDPQTGSKMYTEPSSPTPIVSDSNRDFCFWTPSPNLGHIMGCTRIFTLEETLFIWYHLIDLSERLFKIESEFNIQFPDKKIDVRMVYCTVNMLLHRRNVFPKGVSPRVSLKDLKEDGKVAKMFGVKTKVGIRFPWMGSASEATKDQSLEASSGIL